MVAAQSPQAIAQSQSHPRNEETPRRHAGDSPEWAGHGTREIVQLLESQIASCPKSRRSRRPPRCDCPRARAREATRSRLRGLRDHLDGLFGSKAQPLADFGYDPRRKPGRRRLQSKSRHRAKRSPPGPCVTRWASARRRRSKPRDESHSRKTHCKEPRGSAPCSLGKLDPIVRLRGKVLASDVEHLRESVSTRSSCARPGPQKSAERTSECAVRAPGATPPGRRSNHRRQTFCRCLPKATREEAAGKNAALDRLCDPSPVARSIPAASPTSIIGPRATRDDSW